MSNGQAETREDLGTQLVAHLRDVAGYIDATESYIAGLQVQLAAAVEENQHLCQLVTNLQQESG